MPITDEKIEGYIRNLIQREEPDITERSVGFLYARLIANPARFGIARGVPKNLGNNGQVPTYEDFVRVCVESFGPHEEEDGLFVKVRRA